MQGSRDVHFTVLAALRIIKVRIIVLIKWFAFPFLNYVQLLNLRWFHNLGMQSNFFEAMLFWYSLLEPTPTIHHSNIGSPI